MKIKNLFLAALAIVGLATMAQAQTIVITGSSAYRGSVDSALIHLGFTATAWITGKTSANGNAALYTGSGTYSGYIVKTSWSGSAAGIQTVAATSPTKTVGVFADGTTGANADPRSGSTQVRPDIAMADNTQSSTRFNGTFLSVTYASLAQATITPTVGSPAQGPVGVVGFVWALSKSASLAPYSFTNDTINMTSQVAQNIWSLGYGPLSMLTGNSADETVSLIADGRDPDSGTRITALAESGIGINNVIQQYAPVASGGAITSLGLYPATTINGVPVPEGESGESSGGTLAGLMGNTGPTAGISPSGYAGFLVAYLSKGDADTITGGVRLLYNGAAYSTANIQEGKYTFWGYEQLFYRPGITGETGGTVKKAFADALASKIYNVDASIAITSMKVARSYDGGVVTPNF